MGEEDAHEAVDGSAQLWGAVRTIAIADAVMSLDNVLAISAASHGNIWLFSFGLLLSIPLIIFGSQLITSSSSASRLHLDRRGAARLDRRRDDRAGHRAGWLGQGARCPRFWARIQRSRASSDRCRGSNMRRR